MMRVTTFTSPLPEPIRILEKYLEDAGTSIIKAAFQYSFFVDPARVRERCPYYPERARMSREHYPKGDRGERRQWKGSDVTLGDNKAAQEAWVKYTSRRIARGSGYGVRHIWGLPWDPSAFTAGWNLCYMPFWLGMLTEDQHPHKDLLPAIQQASFDLYFRNDPVCEKPDYVIDHGIILEDLLGDETIQILSAEQRAPRNNPKALSIALSGSPVEKVIAIRRARNASWSNLGKAISALQGQPHEPFGTPNVASTSKSIARLMLRETGLTLDQLDNVVRELTRSQ